MLLSAPSTTSCSSTTRDSAGAGPSERAGTAGGADPNATLGADAPLPFEVGVFSSALLPPSSSPPIPLRAVSWVFATSRMLDGGAAPPDSPVQFAAIPLVRGLRQAGWGNSPLP